MINQGFKGFIELLNNKGVRYLMVGGYAIALNGYPRYTNGIDIWIDLDHANAEKVRQLTTNNLPAWFKNTNRHSGITHLSFPHVFGGNPAQRKTWIPA